MVGQRFWFDQNLRLQLFLHFFLVHPCTDFRSIFRQCVCGEQIYKKGQSIHTSTMKFHIIIFYNALQRAKDALKCGILYAENEDYFEQFLDLKQEEFSVLEYFEQFSRLQDACGMEDDEERDLISFIRGLRPDIVERMNDCTTIHEAYWEAIRVERMLKQSPLGKVIPQDKKSP